MPARKQPVDAKRVETALQRAAEETGQFISHEVHPKPRRVALIRGEEPSVVKPSEEKSFDVSLAEPNSELARVMDIGSSPPDEGSSENDKGASWRNPNDDLMTESAAVAALMITLREMGVSSVDAIRASIESETNFREAIESRLRAEGEIDAMIAGLESYIETLNARVASFKKAKKAIRQVLYTGMTNANTSSLPTMYGTIYTNPGKYSLDVKSEGLLSNAYFARVVDTTKLRQALSARLKGLEEIGKIADDGERAEARERLDREHPPIEGAELVQGEGSVGIRRK